MVRGRALILAAVVVLPAAFVRLELCPVLRLASPAAEEMPCHKKQGSSKSASCCADHSAVSADGVVHVVPALPVTVFEFRTAVALDDQARPSHLSRARGDPPLIITYRTLLI